MEGGLLEAQENLKSGDNGNGKVARGRGAELGGDPLAFDGAAAE